jgi:hypothetical protein
MRIAGAGTVLVSLALLFGGCVGHERAQAANTAGRSADTVKILSVSPTTESVLHPGEKVPVRVEVEYTLDSSQSGTITLVIQQGEYGGEPLANETRVVQKGSGKLVLAKEIDVPKTSAIQLFTPLSPQGATSTTVVDTRAYAVASR